MKMLRKGQAALEFLTTYGWAFLVILVMIGALAYFGVLDVGRLVPESCQLDSSLECTSYAVYQAKLVSPGVFNTGNNNAAVMIEMGIKNNLPDQIDVTDVYIKEIGADGLCRSGSHKLFRTIKDNVFGLDLIDSSQSTTLSNGDFVEVRFMIFSGLQSYYLSDCDFTPGEPGFVGDKKRFLLILLYS